MRMLLADGKYEGRQVLSPGIVHEMETPQMLIGGPDGEAKFLSALNPDSRFYAYGLGLFLQDYAGTKVAWHSGHIDGMSAGLGMVPSEHLGVVVLSNMDQSWLPMALVWRVVDAYEGRPEKDWSAEVLKAVSPSYAADRSAEATLEKAYQAGPAPLPLSDYAGIYRSELYGDITVSLKGDRLMLHVSKRFDGELKHWVQDTFQVQWSYAYLGKSYATFDLDATGKPATLNMLGVAYIREEPAQVGE